MTTGLGRSLTPRPCTVFQPVRSEWYNPWDVVAVGRDHLDTAWRQTAASQDDDGLWLQEWRQRAQALTQLFVTPARMDDAALAATIRRELAQQAQAEQEQKTLPRQRCCRSIGNSIPPAP